MWRRPMMSPDIVQLQNGFRANALRLDADAMPPPAAFAALRDAIRDDGIPAEQRLAIHRNHFAVTLVDALGGVFDATRVLLGADFFDAFALRFARAAPPTGPCLFEYGADFPAALAMAPELAEHGYAAALARLEWAMHASFHAPAAVALNPTRLAAVPSDKVGGVRLRPHPTLRLIAAEFQVDALWRGVRAGDVAPAMLAPAPTHILLLRPTLDVELERVAPSLYKLIETLAGGANLAAAAASVDCDFSETLGDGLGRGVFADEIHSDS